MISIKQGYPDLNFGIVQLEDRTDPEFTLWVASDAPNAYSEIYYINYKLQTGKYNLLMAPSLSSSFSFQSKVVGMSRVSQEKQYKQAYDIFFPKLNRIPAIAV